MARLARLFIPGCPQHIIQRGNNRQVCFFEHQDYNVYLSKLEESAKKHNVKIHAFVLMTNHVHLLMTAEDKFAISHMMQSLGRFYVSYVNKTYHRTGTLWEGRFKSTIVDSERYLLTVYRYIELNPVRAGMVNMPGEYPWSSYHQNALNEDISLITSHEAWLALGANTQQRKTAYRKLFEQDIPKSDLSLIRESANKAWVLSDERFLKQIESQLNRQPLPKSKGGDRRSAEWRINRT